MEINVIYSLSNLSRRYRTCKSGHSAFYFITRLCPFDSKADTKEISLLVNAACKHAHTERVCARCGVLSPSWSESNVLSFVLPLNWMHEATVLQLAEKISLAEHADISLSLWADKQMTAASVISVVLCSLFNWDFMHCRELCGQSNLSEN